MPSGPAPVSGIGTGKAKAALGGWAVRRRGSVCRAGRWPEGGSVVNRTASPHCTGPARGGGSGPWGPRQWPHWGCWPVGGETGLSQAAAVGTQHSSSSWLTMPGEPTSCLGNGSAPGLAPGNAVVFGRLPAWLRHVPFPMAMTPLGLLLCHSSGVPWCARAGGSSPRQSAPACCLAGSRRLVPGIAWPCDHGGGCVLACHLHSNFGVSPLLWGQGRE